MTGYISERFNRRRTEGGNADYVRTGRLFALTPAQADEAIAILTKELDPRGRRPYSLFLDRNNIASSQQHRISEALAQNTRRRIDVVDLSQRETAPATASPAPARLDL